MKVELTLEEAEHIQKSIDRGSVTHGIMGKSDPDWAGTSTFRQISEHYEKAKMILEEAIGIAKWDKDSHTSRESLGPSSDGSAHTHSEDFGRRPMATKINKSEF